MLINFLYGLPTVILCLLLQSLLLAVGRYYKRDEWLAVARDAMRRTIQARQQ